MGEKYVVCNREQGPVSGIQFLGLVRVVQVRRPQDLSTHRNKKWFAVRTLGHLYRNIK